MQKYIELTCSICQKIFSRPLKQYKYQSKISGSGYSPICGKECQKLFRKSRVAVNCDYCNNIFEKVLAEIKNTSHNFCNHSCAANFINNKRKFLSKNIEANCKYCNRIFLVNLGSAKKVCDPCKKIRKRRFKSKLKESKCLTCENILFSISGKKKYCDPCRSIFFKAFGKKLATIQCRRSKNEIYFADLCIQEFKHVTTNDPIFVSKYGAWDADVVIHDFKIAALWNGVWHYKKVREGHSVKQVRARDKIKMDVIRANGFISYIIKDEDKHNKKFVEEQFIIFKEFLKRLRPIW